MWEYGAWHPGKWGKRENKEMAGRTPQDKCGKT
jgi:hypothetical protein